MGMFTKAERKRAKAKIAVVGASGSGKTMSSILIARGLVGNGKKIAMIDTEQGSGELYSHLTEYDVARINAPFAPNKLIDAIHEAEDAKYDVLIIDSLSPFWSGSGGLLEIKTSVEQRGKNSFTAWADVTPIYNSMMEAIITSPIHIVATMRTKTEWVVAPSKGEGLKVTKVGTAPVQRDGAEYEFTLVFTLDQAHSASASKDRTGLFDTLVFKPSNKTGEKIREWLESGAELKPEVPEQTPPAKEMTRSEIIREERKNAAVEPKSSVATPHNEDTVDDW